MLLCRRERTERMSVEVERKFVCGPDIQTRLNDLAAVCLGCAQFLDQYFDTPDCRLTLRDVWLRRRQGSWELKCRDGATRRRSAAESRQQERGGDALCTRYREITELAEVIARVREELREGDHEQAARVRDGQMREDGGGEGKSPASTETQVTGTGARLGTGSDIGQGNAEIPPTGSDIKTSDTEDPPTGSQVSGGEEENSSPSWVRELGLFPFAQFTTERCSYILPMEGEEEEVEGGGTRIDLDRTDFGFCVGEIEVLVQSPEEMDSALRKIERTAQRLGLSGDQKVPGKMDAYLQKFRPEHYGKLLSAHVL
ncbi:thiamine-triphosphatase isoform X3 [Lepisosteus oculatus]|uniref:thiamine-triphosphatase isoform X3 n=1 Tax=Lepisosteus oculatus TaxID=7918 RepID=UPI00371568B3